jgi:hypothetical protein
MADKKSTVALCLPRAPHFAALLVTGCARKESRGFAATSLRQLRARLERHIEPGFAPGMVGLVASGPEVETFVLGKMAFEGHLMEDRLDDGEEPIRRDLSVSRPAPHRRNASTRTRAAVRSGCRNHGLERRNRRPNGETVRARWTVSEACSNGVSGRRTHGGDDADSIARRRGHHSVTARFYSGLL